MRFPIIVRSPPCSARCILSFVCLLNFSLLFQLALFQLIIIARFISATVAVGRFFNAASKKENTEEMSMHFLIKRFLKSSLLPLGS